MEANSIPIQHNRLTLWIHIGVCGIMAIILLAVYWNTFNASWHLDDKPNILDNSGLHIRDLRPATLVQTFFTLPKQGGIIGNRLHRPIPCLTLAINWYFGKDNVFGYHIVNLSVHILTAIFLYFVIVNLLQTPNLKNLLPDKVSGIAFLAAILWAVNPIQTQAVTYIVQRMAAIAAMFYLLSIYFYIKCRRSHRTLQRTLFLFGCAICFVFALGSKENTVMLPFALVIIEIICFQDLSNWQAKRLFWWGSVFGGILLIIICAWVFIPGNPISLINGYEGRPFNLAQRVLTEPRIVLYYLSLIFYPIPTRLSIEHDIVVSTSLFHPWMTLPAILLTLVFIGIGISQIKKRPVFALAILFFYLNHIIESTFIPLELIFEHRNYLPSLFLFLPIAVGFFRLLDYGSKQSRRLKPLIISAAVLIIISLGTSTYIRNMAWINEKALWEDAAKKAPNSQRPLHNLVWAYYTPSGQYDKAIKLYEKALTLRANNKFAQPTALSNLALLYVHKKDYNKAKDLWNEALAINPEYEIIRHRYVVGLIEMGEWETALKHINILLSKHPRTFIYNQLKATILLNQGNYSVALRYFDLCMQMNPNSKQALLGVGICYNLTGRYEQAESIFSKVLKKEPDDELTLLWLVETNLNVNDRQDVERYLKELLTVASPTELRSLLNMERGKDFLPAESKIKIIKLIENSAA